MGPEMNFACKSWLSILSLLVLVCSMLVSAESLNAQSGPCDSQSNGSVDGCWENITPCSSWSLWSTGYCPTGFPPIQGIHAILTHVGKVLFFANTRPGGPEGRAAFWDPFTRSGSVHWIENEGTNPRKAYELFCSGHAVLGDGKVLFVGGTYYENDLVTCPENPSNPPYPFPSDGHKRVYVFDPTSPGFTQVTPMARERWYPTATLLPNGKVLVTSGGNCDTTQAIPELYNPEANTWVSLTSASNTRYGNNYYPFMHVRRDGKVWHIGPNRSTGTPPLMETLIPTPGSAWNNFGPSEIAGAGSAMYITGHINALGQLKTGQIFKSGGPPYFSPPTDLAEVVLEDGTRVAAPSLAYARYHHNQTILADGSILITGGTTNFDLDVPVYATELYKPGTNPPSTIITGDTLAPTPIKRMYHATAILLPDGSVLSMGGNSGSGKQQSGDFFFPPYLYKNNDQKVLDTDRPGASAVYPDPALVGTGTTFTVTSVTPGTGATSIDKVAFVRPGSVTHVNNFDQRYIPLAFSWNSGNNVCTVTSPSFAEEAPPGYYMLFLVNSNGHPSKAKFVRIWGIENTTINHIGTKFCQNCLSTFKLDVAWSTNLGTDVGVKDRLKVYPPGVSCPTGTPFVAEADPVSSDPTRRTHRVIWQGGCAVGTWRYSIESTSSMSPTTSVSSVACREIVVGSCPSCGPCELE